MPNRHVTEQQLCQGLHRILSMYTKTHNVSKDLNDQEEIFYEWLEYTKGFKEENHIFLGVLDKQRFHFFF